MTREDLKELIAEEVKRVIREDLTIEFTAPHFMNDNFLRIDLSLSGHGEISSILLNASDIPKR